jgi:SAM-dependent methyltransferase
MTETIIPSGPNADQIKYWNAEAGTKWSEFNPQLDRMLAPLSAVVIDCAAPVAGEQVLDIGCGCGDTTMALARRVAPDGAITGVDISTPMLDVARRRATDDDLPITLFNADAETHDLGAARFDLAFSRFGVMFFNNPEAAFANIGGALRPGGRLTFVCWQPLAHNPWARIPFEAIRHLMPPADPPDPHAPGPFAFADSERVKGIITAAGFEDVAVNGYESIMKNGEGDLDTCVRGIMNLGPAARMLREADEATMAAAAKAVRDAVGPYHTGNTLELSSAVWIVTGRRP